MVKNYIFWPFLEILIWPKQVKNEFFDKNKNSKRGQNSTFEPQNHKSDTTFISSTFKVEETKVVLEF